MKKFFISLSGLFVAIAMTAKTQVVMYDQHGMPVRHNSGVPLVDSEDDEITITSDTLLYNVDVVIRDQYGNVMHQSTQTIGPSETTISVPSFDGDSEKTTIDLYYDRKHLSGYFEE